MARSVQMAPRRRNPRRSDEDRQAEVVGRLEALEDRLRILEARLREVGRLPAEGKGGPPGKRVAARTRPRPRCPGCTLELPKGRRGDSCVWCGFVFSAVGRRASR